MHRGTCSNNTNKLSPQEHASYAHFKRCCSNNTNKLSPQEQGVGDNETKAVQIIQINLVLKNVECHTASLHTFK